MSRDGAPSRQSILAAVGRIVTAQGVEGIRVRQIATEAGLSPAAVLYHFPDQDALILAVHEEAVGRYLAHRRAVRDDATSPWEQVQAIARAGVPPWADEQTIRLFFEMHGRAARSTAHARLLDELWAAEQAMYVQIIEAGVAGSMFRITGSTVDVATQLLALEDGLVLQQVSGNPLFDGEFVLRAYTAAARVLLGVTD